MKEAADIIMTIGKDPVTGTGPIPDTRDLVDLLALSHVPRWAILPMLRHQTVAEHSYRVAVITHWLYNQADPGMMHAAMVTYALAHDAEEARTGDIPGPAKRSMARSMQASCPKVLCEDEDLVDGPPDHLGWTQAQYNCWCMDIGDIGGPAVYRALVKLADLIEAYTWLQRWGSACDHRHRVLVELWRDVMKVAADLDQRGDKVDGGWGKLVHTVRDAMVYEAR